MTETNVRIGAIGYMNDCFTSKFENVRDEINLARDSFTREIGHVGTRLDNEIGYVNKRLDTARDYSGKTKNFSTQYRPSRYYGY